MKKIILTLSISFWAIMLFAQSTFTTIGDGNNWNTVDSWIQIIPANFLNGNPSRADNAIVGHNVVVSADAKINDLTINGILTIKKGATLIINGNLQVNNTLLIDDGILIVKGDVTSYGGTVIGSVNGIVNIAGKLINDGVWETYEHQTKIGTITGKNQITLMTVPSVPLSSLFIFGIFVFIVLFSIIKIRLR